MSPRPAASQRLAVEWPTVILAGVIYGGWLAMTFWHRYLPAPILFLAGGWLIAWHGSLQHETIHGHPTNMPWLNRWVGWPPLSLWLPYDRYRQTHVAHHAAEDLTHPDHDPESRYLASSNPVQTVLSGLQSTLSGRLMLGPLIEVGRFLADEAKTLCRGDGGRRRIWTTHAIGVTTIIVWLQLVCRLTLTEYLVCFIYPGATLSLLRPFAEHRADPRPERRIAVVEAAPIMGLLYLNNNLHVAHHAHPGAPWWRLPELHKLQRPSVVASGAPIYRGYNEVVRRYLFARHDVSIRPQSVSRQPTSELAR